MAKTCAYCDSENTELQDKIREWQSATEYKVIVYRECQDCGQTYCFERIPKRGLP